LTARKSNSTPDLYCMCPSSNVVFCVFYSTVTLNFDLFTPASRSFIRVPKCITVTSLTKNPSSNFQDIVSTTFHHADKKVTRTDGRTFIYACSHTMWKMHWR